jgi:hypothetical protein
MIKQQPWPAWHGSSIPHEAKARSPAGRSGMTPEDAPLSVAVTFFSPPREPETHGFVKVTAVDSDVDAVVRADPVDT